MWVYLVLPVVFYGLSLYLFGSMWLQIRKYRASKGKRGVTGQWEAVPRFNAVMHALYASIFAVFFLISAWVYLLVGPQLSGWPLLLALLGCLVAVVVGAILMGRLKSSQFRSP
jgi:hypothetical protein